MLSIGRYVLYAEIASGGMASVHFGRLREAAGFRRIVAVKRLHAELAKDPAFRSMLLDEARVVARIRHANVVQAIEVIDDGTELCLVMDYVPGETLARLRRTALERGTPIPVAISAAIVIDMLRGLHAAHEVTDASGEPLRIVHRDVSPQNVLVGVDGTTRLLDFGIAKAVGSSQTTRQGEVKGKAAYMAPEQLRGEHVDRRADVFAAGIVLWEALCAKRLFAADSAAASMMRVLEHDPVPPSSLVPGIAVALDDVVLRALSRDASRRFQTAADMAAALESAVTPASARDVATWLDEIAGDALRTRAREVAALESKDDAQRPQAVVVAPDASRARTPIARIGVAIVVVVAAAAAVAVGLAFRHGPARDPRAAEEHGAPAAAPPTASEAPAASEIATEPPSNDSPPSPSTSSTSLSASAGAAPPAGSALRAHTRPSAPARASKRDRCNPPYVVDANGIHVMKADCL